MKKSCVIGSPIKHSRSPIIHNYWLSQLKIDGSYETREISPNNLADFLATLSVQGFVGCNITLPHKEAAARLIKNRDQKVARTGSGNTAYFNNGELCLTSTDGEGFIQNLKWRISGLDLKGMRVLILGAGGSARALVDALLSEKVTKIAIANRTLARAAEIVSGFAGPLTATGLDQVPSLIPSTDLLINTTSAGIANSEKLDIAFDRLPPKSLVTDINYVPLITPFLQDAAAAGHMIVPGLGMLLHQAVRGFELWFGERPEVTEELYDLVAQNIDPGYTK